MGKELNEAEVSLLAEHLSFDNMKNNPAVNYEAVMDINRKFKLTSEDGHFMRSGQVGNYKETMSPEIILEFDQWTQENLAGNTLSFWWIYQEEWCGCMCDYSYQDVNKCKLHTHTSVSKVNTFMYFNIYVLSVLIVKLHTF